MGIPVPAATMLLAASRASSSLSDRNVHQCRRSSPFGVTTANRKGRVVRLRPAYGHGIHADWNVVLHCRESPAARVSLSMFAVHHQHTSVPERAPGG